MGAGDPGGGGAAYSADALARHEPQTHSVPSRRRHTRREQDRTVQAGELHLEMLARKRTVAQGGRLTLKPRPRFIGRLKLRARLSGPRAGTAVRPVTSAGLSSDKTLRQGVDAETPALTRHIRRSHP